jgi:hypothetical protein
MSQRKPPVIRSQLPGIEPAGNEATFAGIGTARLASGATESSNAGLAWLVTRGAIAAVTAWLLFSWSFVPITSVWLWIVFVVCLGLGFSPGVYVAIAVILMGMTRFARYEDTGEVFGLQDLTVPAIFMAFVYSSLAFLETVPRIRQWNLPASTRRIPQTGGYVVYRMAAILIAILAAVNLLALIPEDPFSRVTVRLTPGGYRAALMIVVLGSAWIIARAVLDLVAWHRISREEAVLYVRSAAAREFSRELGRIETYRLRKRMKP